MNKSALQRAAGISTTSMAKLSRGENLYTEILVKVCTALKCQPGDIVELVCDESADAVSFEEWRTKQ
jgi:DNA-binding Xre family transcriptional regulator